GVVRQHVHAQAALGQAVRGHRLHAQVDGCHGVLGLALVAVVGGLDDVGGVHRHLGGDVAPGHRRLRVDLRDEVGVGRGGGVAGEDAGLHGAGFAQVAGQRTGVDPADADDPVAEQVVFEAALGAP